MQSLVLQNREREREREREGGREREEEKERKRERERGRERSGGVEWRRANGRHPTGSVSRACCQRLTHTHTHTPFISAPPPSLKESPPPVATGLSGNAVQKGG